jgi:DNA-binding response OmpR family regulator
MILVVDADPNFLEKAREILNRDRQVFLATDAKRAFKLAADLGFSVALVDLDLGRENGLELIRQMRECFPDLPVIAISSGLTRDARESAKGMGAVEVLEKPITQAWKPVVERVRSTANRH